MKANAKEKEIMIKNMKEANINGDIVACKECLIRCRPVRFIIPDFQPGTQNKCTWCSTKITKGAIGRTFTKIGRIESGVTRYFNSKKKLVNFKDMTTEEKANIGLTPTGNQKERQSSSGRKYY